ncbi:MAG: MFS transporter [Planctomycetota bacterium]|jgi:MFS family permease
MSSTAPSADQSTLPADHRETGFLARTFASFRTRNYRRFFFGQGTSVLGLWLRNAAQGWLVYDLTGSKLLLGAVAACTQLSLCMNSPLGGVIADRFDKRRLLMFLSTLSGALSLTLAALVFTGNIEVWHVMAVAILAGSVKGYEIPARQSFIVEMVGRDLMPNAIALNTATFNTARVIGPALGGILMGELEQGIAVCFLLDGLSYFAFVFAVFGMRPVARATPKKSGGWREDIAAGIRFARGSLRVRTLLTLLAIFNAFGFSFLTLMPAVARDVLGLGATGYGLLMATNGAGALVAALWVAGSSPPRDKRRLRRQLFGAVFFSSAMVVLFSLTRSTVWAIPPLVFAGAGGIAFFSRANALVQMAVPDAIRGRVMSLWVFTFIGAMGVGGLLIGTLAQAVTAPVAITVFGALSLVLSTIVFLRLPAPTPVRPEDPTLSGQTGIPAPEAVASSG